MSDPIAHNRLLSRLSDRDKALLAPELEAVDLPVETMLEASGRPETHAYFPSSGIGSTVSTGAEGRSLEVGLFGSEGMSGTAIVMEADQTPLETFMQVGGEGVRIRAEALRAALEDSATLRRRLLRFIHAQHIQVAQTAVANGHGRLEERLARWLLMCHDRNSGPHIRLTHRFLAKMLCVRRAGVTVTLHQLEGRGLIKAEREDITIRDREGLLGAANGSYGLAEQEYERLLA